MGLTQPQVGTGHAAPHSAVERFCSLRQGVSLYPPLLFLLGNEGLLDSLGQSGEVWRDAKRPSGDTNQ